MVLGGLFVKMNEFVFVELVCKFILLMFVVWDGNYSCEILNNLVCGWSFWIYGGDLNGCMSLMIN